MASLQGGVTPQQEMINRRLPVVIGFLIVVSGLLLLALARYQWLSPELAREFELRGRANISSIRRLPAERGTIYDRDGQPLAVNTIQYGIGVSPSLITEPREIARQLGVILGMDEFTLFEKVTSDRAWELIARPVPAEVGQQIADLDQIGLTIDPLSSRFYPQGAVAGQVIGFVVESQDNTYGAMGVEGRYNDQLAGRVLDQEVSNIPFDLPIESRSGRQGMSLVLTIDRDIQFWVESELERAITETGATQGTIIIMDPNNGDILAMASHPTFDPNNFIDVEDPNLLRNPAISAVYEPGSVMKVLTVAGALEQQAITPQWTYADQGEIEVGGITVRNWDRRAHGTTDVSRALVESLNVGMATIALEMGPDDFYASLRAFGIGQPTRVDLMGEEAGILKVPGDPDWSESDLATNSFGQGVSVTPLQMLTAVCAIANDGLMYKPRVVRQIIDGENVIDAEQQVLRRAISPETARLVTDMMVRVVEEGAPLARLEGYTIAGKTGTAQISSPVGYEPNASIVTFVGFMPAYDPQVAVLVKLDRPDGYWGSQVAAPVFRRLAERLVILLGIPTDEIQRSLADAGGS